MTDREKVIKGLECCSFRTANTCRECPYGNVYGSAECAQMAKDALELLKEQEPALPTWSQGKAYCGKCGQRLPRKSADREINYCSYCGRAVKWDAVD